MASTMTTTTDATMSLDGCRFCDVRVHETVIVAGGASRTIASVGALVDGWVLVIPDRHVLSTSELSDAEWSDFARDIAATKSRVEGAYGDVVTFEHGSAGTGRSAGCGVDHAHVHVVPLDVDLRAAVAEISSEVGEFVWRPSNERPLEVPGEDYLHIVDRTGAWIARSELLPSQVIRRALAAVLSESVWDWKLDARQQHVDATINALVG